MTELPLRKLQALFGDKLQENVRMANYTTTRVGGPASGLISVYTADEMRRTVKILWELDAPFRILGSGSNLLVSDSGYKGVMVHNRCHNVRIDTKGEQPIIFAEGGANLGAVSRQASLRGVSGFEWANSIPGTVGGAVYGNAGAHGSDISSCMIVAQVITKDQGEQSLDSEDMGFRYRSSKFKRSGEAVVILSTSFSGTKVEPEVTQRLLEELTEKRRKTQPVGPSFGSTFKNPKGDYAGRLLEAAGMKGATSGHASISTVHANFILNDGEATAQDYYRLIRLAQKTVKEQFDVSLKLEIELLGEFEDD
ncbi:MAG TPA: UDP-N-acetylmuramate dehydrogenase [Anaerolineaceae bacterium]|nr:UDP-N-acetylmuramate dehydrogenase [Anaerolineaceae bacterium]